MKTINNYRFIYLLVAVCCAGTFSSCKKYLEIDLPKDQVTSDAIFSNATNTLAAVNGLYTFSLKNPNFLNYQGDELLGFAADEFVYGSNPQYDDFMNNSLTGINFDVSQTWQLLYSIIYQANSVIEGVPTSPISDSLKAVYIAEAKVFRSYCQLYLTNLWGDVPLIQTTNVTISSTVGRTPKTDVLNAIASDLRDAENNLPVGTVRNGRINKYVATALLARVSLYQKNWADAEAKATSLISNTANFSLLTDLTKVFLRNSKEAIWQANTADTNYTWVAGVFVPSPSATSTQYLALMRPELYNAFETGDKRKTSWVGYNTTVTPTKPFYFNSKYKSLSKTSTNTEDYMILRLAEQYLIRAEARAQQNNLNGAIDDINAIRTRAGLTLLAYGMSQSNVLLAIEQERKVELFAEGSGHRWNDLVRTGRIDAVMKAEKPTTWKSQTVWPIPDNELLNNPALGK